MSTAEQDAAARRLNDLMALLRTQPPSEHFERLTEEAEALGRAIAAFHLEGIRFRIYNVDRMVSHGPVALPPEAAEIVADVRKHLEAAGFHTRSHSLP
jgi:hypothetical protein